MQHMVHDVLREVVHVLPNSSAIHHAYVHDRPSLHNGAGAAGHGQFTKSQCQTWQLPKLPSSQLSSWQLSSRRFPTNSPGLACKGLMQHMYCREDDVEHSKWEQEQPYDRDCIRWVEESRG
jgi:hypothetical protein